MSNRAGRLIDGNQTLVYHPQTLKFVVVHLSSLLLLLFYISNKIQSVKMCERY